MLRVPERTRSRLVRAALVLAEWLVRLALAWGALAFGGVYPWAYTPLLVAVTVAGVIGLAVPSSTRVPGTAALAIALAVFLVAVAAQLVPLPIAVVRSISPASLDAARQLDLGAAARTSRALSIAPDRTWLGLAFFGAFALFTLGTARLLSMRGVRPVAESIAVLGGVLALVGIIQKPLYTGRIYGFWTPLMGGNPYGPFVNRNHFAGWMLMGVPPTFGAFVGGVASAMRGIRPTWHARLVWWASPDASRLVLTGAVAALMGLALVLSMSRSGLIGLAGAALATALVVVCQRESVTRKAFTLAYLAVFAGVVIGVGGGAISTRLGQTNGQELSVRLGAWADARSIAARFPAVGTGLNTYGVATLLYQEHGQGGHYAEAHNDYLQLWTEGGVLLAAPALLVAGVFAALVRRRFVEEVSVTSHWLRVGAVVALAAIALQEAVDFSLQMPGNAALFAVVCAIALHRSPRLSRPEVRL